MRIAPWTEDEAKLAQRFSTLYLRLTRLEGSAYFLGAVDPSIIPSGSYSYVVCAHIKRGILTIDDAPREYFLWDQKERALKRNLGPSFGGVSVDNVPWEIHHIEGPATREAARDAYIWETLELSSETRRDPVLGEVERSTKDDRSQTRS